MATGTDSKRAQADDLAEIARDAYIYAFPIVLMEVSRYAATNVREPSELGAPMNRFAHKGRFPDDTFTQVVRPNADTLYSSMYFDVSSEPLVVTIPDSCGRYFLFPALDMWSDVFTSPGSRTTGSGAQEFALVSVGWHGTLPHGVREVRCPTDVGWMIGRAQTNGTRDYDSVHAFQAGVRTTPLHHYGKSFTWPKADVKDAWTIMKSPLEQVLAMDAAAYFSLFADLLKTNAPHAHDYPMLDRLRRLGIDVNVPCEFTALSAQTQAELREAMPMALTEVKAAFAKSGALANGWRINLSTVGSYGTNYLGRAATAYAGLGANTPEDAVYPTAVVDADGKPFTSAGQYVLHLDKTHIPPVRAFWSLTMYDARQLFASNAINRYAIGDRDPLVFNADGSLDIYIQRESPGAEKEANWLPTPANGAFSMNLRLYWPRAEVLLGDWTPPPVKRLR